MSNDPLAAKAYQIATGPKAPTTDGLQFGRVYKFSLLLQPQQTAILYQYITRTKRTEEKHENIAVQFAVGLRDRLVVTRQRNEFRVDLNIDRETRR